MGVWSENGWRDVSQVDQRLEPSHFALSTGLDAGSGRWFQNAARHRLILVLGGGLAFTLLLGLLLGQLGNGDLWALCAPLRSGSGASAAIVNR